MVNLFNVGEIPTKLAVTRVRTISKTKAKVLAAHTHEVHVVQYAEDTEVSLFAFVDQHGIPDELGKDWIPVTFPFPISVKPRPNLESGRIDRLYQLIDIFYSNATLLETTELSSLTPKEFFDFYAEFTIHHRCKDLGSVFADKYDDKNSYLRHIKDNEKAFWYIATNYLNFN